MKLSCLWGFARSSARASLGRRVVARIRCAPLERAGRPRAPADDVCPAKRPTSPSEASTGAPRRRSDGVAGRARSLAAPYSPRPAQRPPCHASLLPADTA